MQQWSARAVRALRMGGFYLRSSFYSLLVLLTSPYSCCDTCTDRGLNEGASLYMWSSPHFGVLSTRELSLLGNSLYFGLL